MRRTIGVGTTLGGTTAWLLATIGLFVFGTAYVGIELTREAERTAFIWFANAAVVASLLRQPRARRPIILLVGYVANLSANLLSGDALATAGLLSLCNTAEILIGVTLVDRFDGPVPDLTRVRSLALFIACAGLAGPAVAALAASLVLSASAGADPLATAERWFLADALGMITLGPLLLTVGWRELAAFRHPRSAARVGMTVAGVASVTALVFAQSSYAILFVVPPLLVLVAFRTGFGGAAAAVTGVAIAASIATIRGDGPIAMTLPALPERVLYLQFFLAVCVGTTLLVAAVLAERGRLASAFAASERRFRSLADVSPAGMFRADAEGDVTYVNDAWCRLTGLSPDAALGDGWLTALDPVDRPGAEGGWRRLVASQASSVAGAEVRFRHGDGSERWGFTRAAAEFDDAGTFIGLVGVTIDITSEHMSRTALAESEARLNAVLNSAIDAIVVIDERGVINSVNAAARRVFGYPADEMLGLNIRMLIPEGDALDDDRHASADPETGQRKIIGIGREIEGRRKDGSVLPLDLTIAEWRDARGQRFFTGIMRDISQRKESERRAADATARVEEGHRLLVMAGEMAHVGYWRVNFPTDEATLSDEAARILGLTPGTSAMPGDGSKGYHPDDRDRVDEALARGAAGETFAFEARVPVTGGSDRFVAVRGQPEFGSGGQVTGLFGIVQDMTEQRAAQAALIVARDAAERASAAKSEFLATMSHEIRTPMTGVLGMVELLRGDADPSQRDRFFDSLEQSARTLMVVLDDVLDYSKIDSGNLRLEAVDFDLGALANTVADLFRNAASAKGLLLELDLADAEGAVVRGDPTRLQQILSNFVSNAIKFTADGCIAIAFTGEAASPGATRWRIEVRDSGIGIDGDATKRLFAPFVQADVSTTRRFGGTGLGLAICKRLVEAMGGEIGVDSTPGIGSTFWFAVTLSSGDPTTVNMSRTAVVPLDSAPLRVLVAEDNSINQLLITGLLQRMGHEATCVGNGRLAVDAVIAASEETPFDVILMDMQMPEMDGIAATRAIRGLAKAAADVPVFALSADALPERRRFYDHIGLTGFLTKPVDIAKLRQALAGIRPVHRPTAARDPAADMLPATPVFDSGRLAELRAAVGIDVVDRLVRLLGIEAANRPSAIRALVAEGYPEEAKAAAHALKGAASAVGAVQLASAAEAIEHADHGADVHRLLDRLDAAAAETRAAIDAGASPVATVPAAGGRR